MPYCLTAHHKKKRCETPLSVFLMPPCAFMNCFLARFKTHFTGLQPRSAYRASVYNQTSPKFAKPRIYIPKKTGRPQSPNKKHQENHQKFTKTKHPTRPGKLPARSLHQKKTEIIFFKKKDLKTHLKRSSRTR